MYLKNNIIDLCTACDTFMQFHPKCTVEQRLDNCVTHNSQKDTPKLGHLSLLIDILKYNLSIRLSES